MRRLVMSCAVLFLALTASGQNVRCESVDGAYRECHVASSGRIVLVYELSELRCIEGVTWGTSSDGRVWVRRGCSAIFTIGTEVQPAASDRVVCESLNGGRSFCSTRTYSRVTLTRKLSSLPCEEGGTWGYDPERGEIWVDLGCRGEFLVGDKPGREAGSDPLDAIVVCRSTDGKKTKCPADTSAGVRMFRTLDGSRCRFGKEWGYDRKQVWVKHGCSAEFAVKGEPRPMIQTVTCESPDGSPAKCEADTTYGVAIARELGKQQCVAGETWGFDDTGVWVSRNCVAQFALGGYRLPPGRVPDTAVRVVCRSEPGERTRCEVDTTRGVGLVKDLTDTTCVLNRSWGYDAKGIWVRAGCSAEFAVAR